MGAQLSPKSCLFSSDDWVPVTQGPPTRSRLLKVPLRSLGEQPNHIQTTAPLSQARHQLASTKPCQPWRFYYSLTKVLFKSQFLSACPVGLGKDVWGDCVCLYCWRALSWYLACHPLRCSESLRGLPTFAQPVGGMVGTKAGCGWCCH